MHGGTNNVIVLAGIAPRICRSQCGLVCASGNARFGQYFYLFHPESLQIRNRKAEVAGTERLRNSTLHFHFRQPIGRCGAAMDLRTRRYWAQIQCLLLLLSHFRVGALKLVEVGHFFEEL